MPKLTEGDFLDGEGAAKLLAYIIQKIETAKQLGKDVAVQTLPASFTTPARIYFYYERVVSTWRNIL